MAILKSRAENGVVRRLFPDLLQFCRINFQSVRKKFIHRDGFYKSKKGNATGAIWPAHEQGWFGEIGEGKSIIKPGGEKKRVHAGSPVMMPANYCNRLLSFFIMASWACHVLIIILREVAAFRFVLLDVSEKGVLRRDLFFDGNGKLPLLDVIVRTLAGVGAIKRFEIIIEISERAELRAGFFPCTTAQVFRVRG